MLIGCAIVANGWPGKRSTRTISSTLRGGRRRLGRAASIYVVGLYLERRSGDPNTIIHSQQRKLLDIRFLRDVGAEDARKAWRESLEQNCKPPCYLDPYDLQRFLDGGGRA